MTHRHSLQSILFTDIVGSTRRAAELGDHGWNQLLDEHHARVRREIRRFGGREIKVMGDGFLAAFPRPANGIRCAWTIRETLRELGLDVRSGIHTGEVEHRGRDLTGLAVHVGSRIAAKAEPGEILVSNAVREMEAGAGFRFEDRGKHELKGVPEAWRLFALKSLPAGPAFRTGRWVPEIGARHAKIAGGALLGLLVLVGIIFVVRAFRPGLEPGEAIAGAAAPGVAVLPFSVSDPELDEWREGMVTLVSTALDGAGDLRAIDSRTLLARWDERVPRGERADRATALEVARLTGARYALLGSAVGIGPELSLVAEVYSVDDGSHLGTTQVQGAPDSVLALVNELTRKSLGLLLEKGAEELPPVDLATLTTSSLLALKAFLEGETLYRRGATDQASESYERAVAADSTFALAWLRLSQTYGWLGGFSDRTMEAHERAMQNADRLPQRERMLMEIELSLIRQFTEGAERAREATQRYPDDAEAWYLLGEFYYHIPAVLAGLDDMERAFQKAVDLDPTFAPYRFHLVEFAFKNPPDSVLAAEQVGGLAALNPDSPVARAARLAMGLAFGDSARRVALGDSMRSLDLDEVFLMSGFLTHPRFWELEEAAMNILVEEGDPIQHVLFARSVSQRGKLAQGLRYLRASDASSRTACWVLVSAALDLPVPEDVLESHLSVRAADSTASLRTECGGLHAADQGRTEEYARALEIHRRAVTRAYAEGDSIEAEVQTAVVQALQGVARWKEGDRQEALRLLKAAQKRRGARDALSIWVGEIYLELDRPAEAVPYFRALGSDPAEMDAYAGYYLGKAYEAAGEYEKARDAYESFVEYWRDADPELQPRVEEARQAALRLRGLQRE
ncbi:MAG: adenylate/guanylate cyclase domain-containing protein [Gemmatimonadota bacterium]